MDVWHDIFFQQRLVLISEGLIWWAIEHEWGFDCNCRCLWGEHGTVCLWGCCVNRAPVRTWRFVSGWGVCGFALSGSCACFGLVRWFTGDRYSALLRVFKGWMVRVVRCEWCLTSSRKNVQADACHWHRNWEVPGIHHQVQTWKTSITEQSADLYRKLLHNQDKQCILVRTHQVW